MKKVVVTGGFDDIRSRHIRFLQEAAQRGELHVLVWDDESISALNGKAPHFPLQERLYYLQAIRFVHQVMPIPYHGEKVIPPALTQLHPDIWVVDEHHDNALINDYCSANSVAYHVLREDDLVGFPDYLPETISQKTPRKKVIVTGCFDWFHSGHVRFMEEVSELGDLYVVVGHDANVRELKGEGHPMFSQDERRYIIQSLRYVRQALISSGQGWMDAEPEIIRIKPNIYAVNEDGDKPEKRRFCQEHDIEYVVLKRVPKDGLTQRQSTYLRGY